MHVSMKVIDDKLKIIDDVPNSAVEMAVKEKVVSIQNTKKVTFYQTIFFIQFLKKVQRQDRIVEEVKLFLKPAYNQRKITKEAYKEILRKTVPKVSSSNINNSTEKSIKTICPKNKGFSTILWGVHVQ